MVQSSTTSERNSRADSALGTAESVLRSISWFLPWIRFREAELASESFTAVLNLIALYRDSLTATRKVESRGRPIAISFRNKHNRYTSGWIATSSLFACASYLLEIIRCLQLVVEILLKRRFSPAVTLKGVFILEVVKATLRVTILTVTGRPLVTPPVPERDPAADILETKQPTVFGNNSAFSSEPIPTPEHVKNNHSFFPPAKSTTSNPHFPHIVTSNLTIDNYLLSKALTPSVVVAPTLLVNPFLRTKEWISEILHILQPLIFVSALIRYPKRLDARPVCLSFLADILADLLRRQPSSTLPLERLEYARRDREYFWYLFRGFIWESYTRAKLDQISGMLKDVPFIGMVSSLVQDWVPLVNQYYYYTSS